MIIFLLILVDAISAVPPDTAGCWSLCCLLGGQYSMRIFLLMLQEVGDSDILADVAEGSDFLLLAAGVEDVPLNVAGCWNLRRHM